MNIKDRMKRILKWNRNKKMLFAYYNRYIHNAFENGKCMNETQYEACIMRLYHTVEKGLSYDNYRAGFGLDNIVILVGILEAYSHKYGCDSECYQTAIDVLQKYVEKNKAHGYRDSSLESRINLLKGEPNGKGGVIRFIPLQEEHIRSTNYEDFIKSRHSIRQFSGIPVDTTRIEAALELAQHTPSACNRQGWKTHVIVDKPIIKKVLQNQNGNRGFGNEIDKLLLITSDLCFFNQDRELFQAYIDGGMYAMSVINGLHYEHIGTIPLSASLTPEQENRVRELLGFKNSEVLILFIGVGSYPESCQTTRSDRHAAVYDII